MTAIKARIRVGPDHSISGVAPEEVPAGEHEVTIAVAASEPAPRRPRLSVRDLPVHYGPWDDSVSLRREDLYGDDGR